MTNFWSGIEQSKYTLRFETDCKEYYKEMEKNAQMIIDRASSKQFGRNENMTVFVIEVIPITGLGRVSSEAYMTLEAAQKFIESRSGNPKKFSEYLYRADHTDYVIFEVRVV